MAAGPVPGSGLGEVGWARLGWGWGGSGRACFPGCCGQAGQSIQHNQSLSLSPSLLPCFPVSGWSLPLHRASAWPCLLEKEAADDSRTSGGLGKLWPCPSVSVSRVAVKYRDCQSLTTFVQTQANSASYKGVVVPTHRVSPAGFQRACLPPEFSLTHLGNGSTWYMLSELKITFEVLSAAAAIINGCALAAHYSVPSRSLGKGISDSHCHF